MTPHQQELLTIIYLSVIAFFYGLSIHILKDDINKWLDDHSPNWYPWCRFCRGNHTGVILGILIGVIIMKIIEL